MCVNFKAKTFVWGRINRENSYRTFSVNLGGGELPKCVWISRQTASFVDAKNLKMRSEMFYKACTEKTSKMPLNFTATSFVFRRIYREISPITFCINLASGKVPKCVWTSRQTVTFLDALIVKLRPELFHKAWMEKTSKIRLNFTANSFAFGRINRDNAPRTFSAKLAGNEHPKCAWTPRQIASFLDANVVIMRPELFYKPPRVKTSEMRLNFAGNNFIFGHINRENTPITFSVNLAGRELLTCAWTQQLRFWTQKSWKCAQKFFGKPGNAENFQNASELNNKQLHYWRKNRENAPVTFFIILARGKLPKSVWISWQTASFWTQKWWKWAQNLFVNLECGELPQCVWTSRQTASFVDAKIVIMRPELSLYTSQGENFRNASELRRKQLHFWAHES